MGRKRAGLSFGCRFFMPLGIAPLSVLIGRRALRALFQGVFQGARCAWASKSVNASSASYCTACRGRVARLPAASHHQNLLACASGAMRTGITEAPAFGETRWRLGKVFGEAGTCGEPARLSISTTPESAPYLWRNVMKWHDDKGTNRSRHASFNKCSPCPRRYRSDKIYQYKKCQQRIGEPTYSHKRQTHGSSEQKV